MWFQFVLVHLNSWSFKWYTQHSRDQTSFSSPECSDWLWDSPNFLLSGYWGLFPCGGEEGVKLTAFLQLGLELRTELYVHSTHMPLWYVQGKLYIYTKYTILPHFLCKSQQQYYYWCTIPISSADKWKTNYLKHDISISGTQHFKWCEV